MSAVLGSRVRLRPDVQLSRPLLRGPAVVHRVKDPSNGQAFEVGAREHFVMTRLDGERTLGDIGDEYASAFGRRLAEPNWLQLLGLLGNRGLLTVPGADASGPDAAPASATVRAVEALHRLARKAPVRAYALLPVLALATVVFLGLQLAELRDGAGWLAGHPLPLLAAVAVIWISAALHELGHGVAALWHGCRVTAVSLLALRCRADGYPYLRSARAQLVIAGIGGVVNALVLLPLAAAWAVLSADADLRAWLGGVLLLGLVQTLVNYVPLPPLDGYRMLGHALHTSELAPSSLRFLRMAAVRSPGLASYPPRAKRIYTAYALTALALGAGAVAGVLLAAGARGAAPGMVIALVAGSMTIAGLLARRNLRDRTRRRDR